MHIVVRTPVSGYTPGQTINVVVEVDNKSEEGAKFNVQLRRVRSMFGRPLPNMIKVTWNDNFISGSHILHFSEQPKMAHRKSCNLRTR